MLDYKGVSELLFNPTTDFKQNQENKCGEFDLKSAKCEIENWQKSNKNQ